MKKQEFRQLIREHIRKIVKEEIDNKQWMDITAALIKSKMFLNKATFRFVNTDTMSKDLTRKSLEDFLMNGAKEGLWDEKVAQEYMMAIEGTAKKQLKETYYNPEWKLTSIQDWIETYAMNNRLNFKLLKKVDKKSGTGSKTTFYVYDIGDKHGIVIKDDKVAGAPRLSEIDVIVGLKGSALGSLSKSYTISGTDGSQQELIKLLDKVLGIKEGQELTEGNIMIFSYAKPYKKPDVSKIRAEADKYIKFLQSKNFNVHTGSDALYFPNFVWAGGKQQLGECIGVLAGSETIVVSPIGENKVFKFGESLLARFVKDDRIPAFLIKGSMEEGRQLTEDWKSTIAKAVIKKDKNKYNQYTFDVVDNGKVLATYTPERNFVEIHTPEALEFFKHTFKSLGIRPIEDKEGGEGKVTSYTVKDAGNMKLLKSIMSMSKSKAA